MRPLFWLLAAPCAWAAQLLLVWWVDAKHCAGEIGAPASHLTNMVIAIVTLLIALLSLRQGLTMRREPDGARVYLSSGAALMGFVFAIAVIIGAMGGITLPSCEITR